MHCVLLLLIFTDVVVHLNSQSTDSTEYANFEDTFSSNTEDKSQPSSSLLSWISWKLQEASILDYDSQDYIFSNTLKSSENRPTTHPPDRIEEDPCLKGNCENDSKCERNPDYPSGYVCICTSTWTGTYCHLKGNGTDSGGDFNNSKEESVTSMDANSIYTTRLLNDSITDVVSTNTTSNHSVVTSSAVELTDLDFTSTKFTNTLTGGSKVTVSPTKNITEIIAVENQTVKNTEITTKFNFDSVSVGNESSGGTIWLTESSGQTTKSDYNEAENNVTKSTLTTSTEQSKIKVTSDNAIQNYTINVGLHKTTKMVDSKTWFSHIDLIRTNKQKLAAKSTTSVMILVDESANSTQSTHIFDSETLVLIGLGILIAIILVLIAISLLKKHRVKGNSLDMVVESGRSCGNNGSSTPEYTNVAAAFDDGSVQNQHTVNCEEESSQSKVYVQSISSTLQTSPLSAAST